MVDGYGGGGFDECGCVCGWICGGCGGSGGGLWWWWVLMMVEVGVLGVDDNGGRGCRGEGVGFCYRSSVGVYVEV